MYIFLFNFKVSSLLRIAVLILAVLLASFTYENYFSITAPGISTAIKLILVLPNWNKKIEPFEVATEINQFETISD